ncbi:MAG: isoprenylcysteine carboxylmethyltransferase family protein [Gemmataceae bacterium]|nr:isoprenylcysteine carboxylmethyltransferase family protein [Gemmataceae bacterium]
MTSTAAALAIYGLLWASFGLAHSLLARPRARFWLERTLGRFHRLIFNIAATIHLGVVLMLGYLLLGGLGWQFPTTLVWCMAVVAIVGLALMVLAVRELGFGTFVGWQQVIDRKCQIPEVPVETLRVNGLYHLCRHPAYLGTLLFFWGLANTPLGLATAVCGTAYILIGTWFEERDLVRKFGRDYEEYQRRVPMFLPSVRSLLAIGSAGQQN